MNKYFRMTGNVLLYIGIWFIGLKFFSFLISWLRQTPFKKVLNLLLHQWGFGVIIFFGIPVLIYMLIFKLRKENFFEFCRFKAISLKDTLIIVLITIAGILFTMHLINISSFLKSFPEFDRYVADAIRGNLFSIILMAGILLPTCEEILFRGLIFNEMRKYLPLVVVLFTHTLIYMPFQPTISIAVYAYLNFTVYALIYILTDSLWGPIIFEALGAVGLYCAKLLGIDLVIRSWGDTYMITAAVVSLILVFVGAYALKKGAWRGIFSLKNGEATVCN